MPPQRARRQAQNCTDQEQCRGKLPQSDFYSPPGPPSCAAPDREGDAGLRLLYRLVVELPVPIALS